MKLRHRRMHKSLLKMTALITAVVTLITAMPGATAVDTASRLVKQTFTLQPENGVTVTLSGMMPANGSTKAEKANVAGEDVLHAYDISIFYPNGAEYEPTEDFPISVSFESEDIAQAIEDDDTALRVEHISDNGAVEAIETEVNDDELVFEAESFSVYVIRAHVTNDENLKPRKTFHFLSPNYTQIIEDDNIYYESAAYRFPNKLNELVTTQTVTDGEALQEIVMPDNNTSGLFYGWYVVHYVSENDGLYTYYWGSEEPQHVAFNEPIDIKEDDDTDVYLAPLFGHYRFLTFHQDVKDGDNANTIITRKLMTLGEDRKCTLKISDVRAPSTNSNRIVFWGWEYTHRSGDDLEGVTETIQTVNADDSEREAYITIRDTHVIAGRQPSEEDIKKESTVRRVDVTSLNLDASSEKAVVNNQGLANDRYEYADIANKQVKLERRNNNFDVNLKDYIKNFTHTDGNLLLGWNNSANSDDYIPDYYADAFIGVNKNNTPPNNTLYAVWEPMVYLTLQNKTAYPVTFELKFTYNGTVYEGHTNQMTGELERQAFSDDDGVEKITTGDFKVTLPVGANIKLVLPEGEGAAYTVTGSYEDATGHKTLIVYNSGDTQSTTISYKNNKWYKNGVAASAPVAYNTQGTLIKGATGQLVMFTEKEPETEINLMTRYYDCALCKRSGTVF